MNIKLLQLGLVAPLCCGVSCYTTSSYTNADLGGSVLELSAQTVLADGVSSSQLTFIGRRGNGTPVSGLTVVFIGTDCQFDQPSLPTDGNGWTSGRVRSSQVGVHVVRAQVQYDTYSAAIGAPLSIDFIPATAVITAAAGQTFSWTVTALDANGQVDTSYLGTVHFTSSDPQATVPPDYPFTAADSGQHNFADATILRTAGVQTVTASDATTGSLVARAPVSVLPAAAASFSATLPTSITVATPFTLRLAASDAFGNPATSYTGTVRFSSSDPNAVLPQATAFSSSGAGSASLGPIVFYQSGMQTLFVTDIAATTPSWQSGNLTVLAGPPAAIQSSEPRTVTAGDSLTLTASFVDAYGNATDSTDTVSLTSTDTQATLPTAVSFVAGSESIGPLVLRTSGPQTIELTDLTNAAIAPAVVAIDVAVATMQGFAVTASPNVVAGDYLSVQGQAVDAYGNGVTHYLGEVFTRSSDDNALIPPPYTLQPNDLGRIAINAIMHTAGTQSVSFVDSTTPTLQGNITTHVQPAVLNGLRVQGLASPCTAGQNQSVQVTAIDAFGNTVPAFMQTVHLSSTDPNAVLAADATYDSGDAGIRSFAVVLTTAGSRSVVATQVGDANITGFQTSQVDAAAPTGFAFTASPNGSVPICAAMVPSVGVALQDAYGNGTPANANVALSLIGGTYSTHLTGATVRALADDGTVLFDDLGIDVAASGYQLQLVNTDPNSTWTSALSAPFSVVDSAPTVTLQNPNLTSACGMLAYTVASTCPVNITVEYDPTGTGSYLRAHQAPANKQESSGVTSVRATAAGTSRVFAWDSSRDLGHAAINQLRVRMNVATATLSGQSNVVSNLVYDSTVNFTVAASAPLAAAPAGIGVADINHDGAPDIVALLPAAIQPLLGTVGAAALSNGTPTAVASAPTALVFADVNRDGNIDIVAVPSSGTAALLFLGTSSGVFAAATSVQVGSTSTAVAVADVNRDGIPDVVTASPSGAAGLRWMLQNPNGSFAAAVNVALPAAATALKLADMNQDGIVDAVLGAGSAALVVAGNGNGFATTSTTALAAPVVGLIVADVNNDGQHDAVITTASPSLAILLGNGSGTLASPVALPLSAAPEGLAVADLDGNGSLDAVVGVGSAVETFAGDGNSTFVLARTTITPAAVTAVTLADVDLDGRLDVLAGQGSAALSVLLNTTLRPCSWGLAAPEAASLPFNPSSSAVGDFDEDGRPDVVVLGATQNLGALVTGDGAGGLHLAQPFVLGTAPGVGAVADWNGDGHLDLTVPNVGDGTLTVCMGDGNSDWTTMTTLPVGNNPNQVVAADMDADGKIDWVVANNGANQIDVLLNLGDGTVRQQASFASDANVDSLAVADFDGDGALDVISANRGANTLTVARGDNRGNLTPLSRIGTCGAVSQVVTGHFNGDAFMDAAVMCGPTMHTYVNDGAGNLTLVSSYTLSSASSLRIQDVNGDGIDDFVTVGSGRLNVGLGVGNGNFTVATSAAQQGGTYTDGVDLDGDGWADVVSSHVNSSANYLVATLNESQGAFYPTGVAVATANGIATADFNHDGSLDCVVASPSNTFTQVWTSPNGTLSLGNTYTTGAGPNAPAVADINRDGWADVVVPSGGAADTRSYFFNPVTMGFAAPNSYPYEINCAGPCYPAGLTMHDVNRDGSTDVVLYTFYDIYIALGNPNGTFGALGSGIAYGGGTPSSGDTIEFADMDNNGTQDLLLPNSSWGPVFTLQLLNGDGSTGARGSANVGSIDAAAADYNHDGKTDIVLTTGSTYIVRILGTGTATLGAQSGVVVGGGAQHVHTADINGDGNSDIVLLLATDSAIAVLTGDGQGGFSAPRYFIGDGNVQRAGLSDINHDGKLDVLVGKTAAGSAPAGVLIRFGR